MILFLKQPENFEQPISMCISNRHFRYSGSKSASKKTMSLYLSKATPPWQNSSIKLTVNGHLKCKLHKSMNFFHLVHICVHCLCDSWEKHVLKERREQGGREERREEEQEENREGGEWMLPLPQSLWVFFHSVLIVILCHNYSTWEDSYLIICSHNNNRFSNLTNTDFWLKYAPLFLLLKHYNLLKLRNQLQYLSFFKTTVYVDILRKFSIYGKGQFNGMKFGA